MASHGCQPMHLSCQRMSLMKHKLEEDISSMIRFVVVDQLGFLQFSQCKYATLVYDLPFSPSQSQQRTVSGFVAFQQTRLCGHLSAICQPSVSHLSINRSVMTLFQFTISKSTFQHCVHSFTPAGLSKVSQDGGIELLLCQIQPQCATKVCVIKSLLRRFASPPSSLA